MKTLLTGNKELLREINDVLVVYLYGELDAGARGWILCSLLVLLSRHKRNTVGGYVLLALLQKFLQLKRDMKSL